MLRTIFLDVCMLSAVLAAQCQTPATGQPPAVLLPKLAHPETFHSDLLDVTFTYPKSMTAEVLPSLKEQHDTIAAQLQERRQAGRPYDRMFG